MFHRRARKCRGMRFPDDRHRPDWWYCPVLVPTTMRPKDHRDLAVWQRANDLAILIHESVDELTLSNQIAYGSQLRRAAASVGANIAEGFARQHRAELIQFL